MFSERTAISEARRFRRSGLDRTSRRIIDLLKERGVEGRSVLEVGGGIGAIQIELLKAGAARAVSVELTPTYERVASQLLREAGLEDRVERRIADFAEAAEAIDKADIVVMNRAICCYPDMRKLAGAAADHTREVLVLTFPKRAWWVQMGLGLGNLALRVARREFHIFVHPPRDIIATAELHGLRTIANRPGFLWTLAAFQGPSSPT
ncbi:MAG: class I SAM-dependent methyltransferase [Candidatus Dormibacterales bacterium]